MNQTKNIKIYELLLMFHITQVSLSKTLVLIKFPESNPNNVAHPNAPVCHS